MTAIFRQYDVHPLLKSGMAQTVVGNTVSITARLDHTRSVFVTLDDGDALLLRIDEPPPHPALVIPTVVLLHGLGGDSEGRYLGRLAKKLTGLGLRTVRFNHRGCGPNAAKMARKIYHSGRVEDVMAALKQIETTWPDSPLYVVGFSLSANILLSLLAKFPDEVTISKVEAALSVSAPIDLPACSEAINLPENKYLDKFFAMRMKRIVSQRKRHFDDYDDVKLPRRFSMREFDDLFTSRLAGYKTRQDYYDQCSAKPLLSKIQLPTTLLIADDDPIIPIKSYEGITLSPSSKLHVTRGGGHMGFIARSKTEFGDRRWMEQAVVDWLRAQGLSQLHPQPLK